MTDSNQHSELLAAFGDKRNWKPNYDGEGIIYVGPSSNKIDATYYVATGARTALASLEEQLETLRNCVEEYADLDNWEAVRSPETTSAWQKRWGHPTPWVDAQHALDAVSNPASEPEASDV